MPDICKRNFPTLSSDFDISHSVGFYFHTICYRNGLTVVNLLIGQKFSPIAGEVLAGTGVYDPPPALERVWVFG